MTTEVPILDISAFDETNQAIVSLFTIGGAALFVFGSVFLTVFLAWAGLRACTSSDDAGNQDEVEELAVRSVVSPLCFGFFAVAASVLRYFANLVSGIIRFIGNNYLILLTLFLVFPLAIVIDSYHDIAFEAIHKIWTCFLTPLLRPVVLPYANLFGLLIDLIVPFINLVGRLFRRFPFIIVFTILSCGNQTLIELATATAEFVQTFAMDISAFLTSGDLFNTPLDVFASGLALEKVIYSTKTILTCLCAVSSGFSCPFYDQFTNTSQPNFACTFNATVAGTASIAQNTLEPLLIGIPAVADELITNGNVSAATAELLRPKFNTTFDAAFDVVECGSCLIDDILGAYYVDLVTFIWESLPAVIMFPDLPPIQLPNLTNPVGPEGPMPIPKVVSCFGDIIQTLTEFGKWLVNFITNIEKIVFDIPDVQLLWRIDIVYDQVRVFIDCVCLIFEYVADLARFFGIEILDVGFFFDPDFPTAPPPCRDPLNNSMGCFLVNNDTAGCLDYICCTNVCNTPGFGYCCLGGWDQGCVDAAGAIDCQRPENAFQSTAIGFVIFEAILDFICCLVRAFVDLLLRILKNISELLISSIYTSTVSPPINPIECFENDTITYSSSFVCTVPSGPNQSIPLLQFAKFYWGDRRNDTDFLPNVGVNEFAVTGQTVVDLAACIGTFIDRVAPPAQCLTCVFSTFTQWIVDLVLLWIDFIVHLDQIIDDISNILNLSLEAPVDSFDSFINCTVDGLRKLADEECVPTGEDMQSADFICCLADLIESAAGIIQLFVRSAIQLIRNFVLVLEGMPPEVPFKDLLVAIEVSLQEFVNIVYDLFCLLFSVIVPEETVCPGDPMTFVRNVLLEIVSTFAGLFVAIFESFVQLIIAFLCVDPLMPDIEPFIEALVVPGLEAFIAFLRALADGALCVGIPELADLFNDIANALESIINTLIDVLVDIVQGFINFFVLLVQCADTGFDFSSQPCMDLVALLNEFFTAIFELIFGVNPVVIPCALQNGLCLIAGDDGTFFGVNATQCSDAGLPLVLCECVGDPLCNLENWLCSFLPFQIDITIQPCMPAPCCGGGCNNCVGLPTFGEFLEDVLVPIVRPLLCALQDLLCVFGGLEILEMPPWNCTVCAPASPIQCLIDIVECASDPSYVRVVDDGTCCVQLPSPQSCLGTCNFTACQGTQICGMADPTLGVCPCTGAGCGCGIDPSPLCACFPLNPTGCTPGNNGCPPLKKRQLDDGYVVMDDPFEQPMEFTTTYPSDSPNSIPVSDLLYMLDANDTDSEFCRQALAPYERDTVYSIVTSDAPFEAKQCVFSLNGVKTLEDNQLLPDDAPKTLFVSMRSFMEYAFDVARGTALLRNDDFLRRSNGTTIEDAMKLMGVKHARSSFALRDGIESVRRRMVQISEMRFSDIHMTKRSFEWPSFGRLLRTWTSRRETNRKRYEIVTDRVASDLRERTPAKMRHLMWTGLSIGRSIFDFLARVRYTNIKRATDNTWSGMLYVSGNTLKRFVGYGSQDSSRGSEYLPTFRNVPTYFMTRLAATLQNIAEENRLSIASTDPRLLAMPEYARALTLIGRATGVELQQSFNDSLVEMYMCDPDAQLCTNCSVVDQIINETAQWAIGVDCYFTEIYENQTLPAYAAANDMLFNDPFGNDTFATNPKTVPFVLTRLATVNWPWTWNLTAFFISIGVDPGSIVPPNPDSPNSIVSIQTEREQLVGRQDIQLTWIDLFLELGADGSSTASGIVLGIVSSAEAFVNFFTTYVSCTEISYNEALWCKNDLGFGLFDGLVLSAFFALIVGLFLALVAPCATCLTVLFVTFTFIPLAFLFGYQSAFFCSLPVDISIPLLPMISIPTVPACIGRDSFELLNELVSPCAPIPQELIDLSSPDAQMPCAQCESDAPVLNCAEAAGFIDGFDNIFFVIGSLFPQVLELLIDSGILNVFPPLANAAMRYTPEMLANNPAALTCFWVTILNVFDALAFLALLALYATVALLATIVPYLLILGFLVLLAFAIIEILTWLQIRFVQQYGTRRESFKLKAE